MLNDKIIELKRERAQIIKNMEEILARTETEKRDFTDEEEIKYKELEKSLDDADKKIARAEELTKRKEQLESVIRKIEAPAVIGRAENNESFRNVADFLTAVMKSQITRKLDDRLKNVEYREQSVGTGTQGGFMVPAEFRPQLMSLSPEDTMIRGRATIVPAGDQPDAAVILNALDQRASQNMYGGVQVNWIAEGGRKPETDFRLRQITLTPHEVAAHIVITDKLLRNWEACGQFAAQQLRLAIREAEEVAFLNGNGVGKPLGILNSSAIIVQPRAAVNNIGYADCVNMLAVYYEEMTNPVWVASPTIKPRLMQMVDPSSRLIWQPNAVAGQPGSLLGIPIYYKYRSPGLGVTGDLMLCDFAAYLIKDGSGPFVGMSDQVYYLDNKTVVKAFWNVDGSPWLTEPIVPSTTNPTAIASPFVVLSSATA